MYTNISCCTHETNVLCQLHLNFFKSLRHLIICRCIKWISHLMFSFWILLIYIPPKHHWEVSYQFFVGQLWFWSLWDCCFWPASHVMRVHELLNSLCFPQNYLKLKMMKRYLRNLPFHFLRKIKHQQFIIYILSLHT